MRSISIDLTTAVLTSSQSYRVGVRQQTKEAFSSLNFSCCCSYFISEQYTYFVTVGFEGRVSSNLPRYAMKATAHTPMKTENTISFVECFRVHR